MVDDAKTIIKRKETLEQKRLNWLNWWQEIAYRVMPSSATFTVDAYEGQRRSERQFSGRPVTANERFSAVMEDLMTPRNQQWHGLGPEEDDLEDDQAVKVFLEKLNRGLFTQRYRPEANFASQKSQGYASIGAFGNSCMFIDEDVGVGSRYRQIFMKEVLWAQNHAGMIDTVYRCFKMEARQIVQRFGDKNLPPKVKAAIDKNDEFKEFDLIHCVAPNEERIESRKDYQGMPWSSYYLAIDDKHIIENSGYTSFPYAIGRYMLAPNEVYARSPAMGCWGAILTINEEKKSIMRAGQQAVEPTLLLSDDGALDSFNMRGHALNYGALSSDGVPLVQPLKMGADIPLGLELMEAEGIEIDDSFLITIFKVLTEHPEMTATQVMEIAQQKAALIAPVMGRQVSEDLGPQIHREIDIFAKQHKNAELMQQMPDSLRESGGLYKVIYTSPLARAMRAQDGVAIMRTFEALGQAIQIDPASAFIMDVPGSVREIAEINGVPAKLVRDDATVQQMKDNAAQQAAASQAAAVAPNLSTSVLNAAKAEQIRSGV